MTDTRAPLPPPAQRGRLDIADRVVEAIARRAAADVSVPHRSEGLNRLTGTDLPRADVAVHAGQVQAAVTVAAQWPSPVADLAERVRAAVAHQVQHYTGLTVTQVQVEVHCLPRDQHRIRRVQ